ncbi:MAG: hypothetical protein HYX53_14860 [Chloroflexi bacterium]|nr:hypothetical protein [Chloroflexota bacterium]
MKSRIIAVMLSIALILAFTVTGVFAANPDTYYVSTNSSCTYIEVTSSFTGSPAYSNTGYWYGSNCPTSYHVHAYFWDSDYEYHYYENTYSGGYGTAQVTFQWWTNDIYGYHKAPSTSSTTWETHAY